MPRCWSLCSALLPLGAVTGLVSHTPAQTWTFLDGPAYAGQDAAYDWTRSRLIWLGLDGDTWEFDDGRLLHRPITGAAPPARTRGALIYDLARRRVLLFGGQGTGTTMLGDTWSWNGDSWTQLPTTTPQPPARVDAAITYDLLRDRVLLYGGQVLGVSQLQDTWEHDGTRWLQRQPTTVPGPNSPVLAYDLLRARSVMVTHPGIINVPISTWEWDGVDWTLRSTAGPTVSGNEGMAYDLVRSRTVLFGGVRNDGQVWEWDGSFWQMTPAPGAPARINPTVYFDPARGRIGVLGGWDYTLTNQSVAQGSARTDNWEWDGSSLVLRHGDLRPLSRYGHVWVADAGRGELLEFGGVRQQTNVDDTWTWDGNAWTQRQPLNKPSPRRGARAVYDPVGNRVLLFGGNNLGQQQNDLWAWNGTDWQLLQNGGGPSTREEVGLAFDVARGELLLFGGTNGSMFNGGLRNDTWTWNGSGWTLRATATAPSVREGAALAFDAQRGVVVLFGGRRGATAQDQLDDTWEWNGAQWRAVAVPARPPALLQPVLEYEGGGSCLLSGTRIVGQSADVQVWRFSGSAYTQLSSTVNPQLGGAILDPRRQRLCSNKGTVIAEWTPTPATVASYGNGCGNPVPRLQTSTTPRVGDPGFGLETRGDAAAPVLFALALGQANLPLGNGCTLLVGGGVTALALSNFAGESELPLPIPDDLALRGLQLHAQALLLDAMAGNPRLTQGLRITLGD